MNWTTPKNKKLSVKKKITNHNIFRDYNHDHDRNVENIRLEKELLKSAVINNLVDEGKRGILFSTHVPDENSDVECKLKEFEKDEFNEMKERIERLEIIVRKLVEYLVKDSDSSATREN